MVSNYERGIYMRALIRKTLTGAEYWDTEAKKTLFVPKGEKPGFEVTKDPETMIGGVDFATGKDLTVTIDGTDVAAKVSEVIDKAKKELHEKESKGNGDTPVVSDLNELTITQLKTYAANSGINIPSDIKKKDDIIKYLSDTE